MSTKPVTVGVSASLKDVVSLMVEKVVGSVFVVNQDNVPVGVFTERELLQDLVTNGKISALAKVGERMSGAVIRITSETSVLEAARIMISGKGRLAVTEKDGAIIGVVTASDLVRAFSEGAENRAIGEIASPKVKTLDAKRTIFDAIQLMHDKRIGSVVVTRDGRPFGIFTERDLLRILGKDMETRLFDIKLEDVASKPLVTASLGISAREAASMMRAKKIKRLPLLKGEDLVAIVTARDLVETYSSVGLPTVPPVAVS